MRSWTALIPLLFALATGLSHASAIDDANKLITAGKHKEAFELLEPLEFDMSGDESFDLLFGFAALESGYTSLASLALERVLAVNPNNMEGRFHLARAYYVLNDHDGARREFELLLSLNPTAGIRATIGQYLDAIAARKPDAKTNVLGYFAYGLGSDSNVEATPDVLKIRDRYQTVSGGFDLTSKLSKNTNGYLGAAIDYRGHNNLKDSDYIFYSARTGLQKAYGNSSMRLGLTGSHFVLDNENYQDSTGLELEWRKTIQQRTQIGITGSFTGYRHIQDIHKSSDYDDAKISFSALRLLGEKGNHVLSAVLEGGHENDTNNRTDGNNDYVKFSLTGQMTFSDENSGFLLISSQKSDYDKINTSISDLRSDSQISAVIGVVLGVTKTVSIRPLLSLTEQDSNVLLNEYSKADISIALRKDFL